MSKSGEWNENAGEVLDKALACAACDPRFTEEEIEVLRNLINGYRGVRILARLSKWFVTILATIALGITAGHTVIEEVLQWLKG